MLGAADYPLDPALRHIAFAESNRRVREALADPENGMVNDEDCLDLFNTADAWPGQQQAIAIWVRSRIAGAAEPPTDLVVHYFGHGGFKDSNDDYFLAINTTWTEDKFHTSIAVASLYRTLRRVAPRLRHYLLIDACFAGAAIRDLQSPLEAAVGVQMDAILQSGEAVAARTGLAALCSSSKTVGSSAGGIDNVTQFTDGLLTVLGKGDPNVMDSLSILRLRELVAADLRERYRDAMIAPVLHRPEGPHGDIAQVPIFPNRARIARRRRLAAPRPRTVADIPLQTALGMPTAAGSDADDFLVERPQYALSYNASLGRPNWVSWHFRASDLGPAPRSDRWRVDPLLPGRMTPVKRADYTGSGYDCGHLCPPHNRSASVADNETTFYMSNVVPQSKIRNQQLWLGLEQHCRKLAEEGWEMFIVAGPGRIAERIAGGRIAVPDLLWKIVYLLPEGGDWRIAGTEAEIIAMEMSNAEASRIDNWRDCLVTVASLEDKLGHGFFTALEPATARILKRKQASQVILHERTARG